MFNEFDRMFFGSSLTYLVGGVIIALLVGVFWHEAQQSGGFYQVAAFATGAAAGLVLGRFYWPIIITIWKEVYGKSIKGIEPESVQKVLESLNEAFIVLLALGVCSGLLLALCAAYQRHWICQAASSLDEDAWEDSFEATTRVSWYLSSRALADAEYYSMNSYGHSSPSRSFGSLFSSSSSHSSSSSSSSSDSKDSKDGGGMLILIAIIVMLVALCASFLTVYILVRGISNYLRDDAARRIHDGRTKARARATASI